MLARWRLRQEGIWGREGGAVSAGYLGEWIAGLMDRMLGREEGLATLDSVHSRCIYEVSAWPSSSTSQAALGQSVDTTHKTTLFIS